MQGLSILVTLLVLYIVYLWRQKTEADSTMDAIMARKDSQGPDLAPEPEATETPTDDSNHGVEALKTPHTRQLVLDALQQLGCEVKEDKWKCLVVNFQRHSFTIEATDDCHFIFIYDLSHFEAPIEEQARVAHVVNEMNIDGFITNLYMPDSKAGKVEVHAKFRSLFLSVIPDRVGYLRMLFQFLFVNARNFRKNYDQVVKDGEI